MPQGVRKSFLLESQAAVISSIMRESDKRKDIRCRFMVEPQEASVEYFKYHVAESSYIVHDRVDS